MVSSTTAAELVLAGALGASLIAAGASVIGGILSRRHQRELWINDKRLTAFTDVIAATNLFRTNAKMIVAAGARFSSTGVHIRDDEIDAYLDASHGLGAAAQTAEIFTTNTGLEGLLKATEDAFGELSYWVSEETQGTVLFSGTHQQLSRDFSAAVDLFDAAHLAFVKGAQDRLKIK